MVDEYSSKKKTENTYEWNFLEEISINWHLIFSAKYDYCQSNVCFGIHIFFE
jgi:hypothetical protein